MPQHPKKTLLVPHRQPRDAAAGPLNLGTCMVPLLMRATSSPKRGVNLSLKRWVTAFLSSQEESSLRTYNQHTSST